MVAMARGNGTRDSGKSRIDIASSPTSKIYVFEATEEMLASGVTRILADSAALNKDNLAPEALSVNVRVLGDIDHDYRQGKFLSLEVYSGEIYLGMTLVGSRDRERRFSADQIQAMKDVVRTKDPSIVE